MGVESADVTKSQILSPDQIFPCEYSHIWTLKEARFMSIYEVSTSAQVIYSPVMVGQHSSTINLESG